MVQQKFNRQTYTKNTKTKILSFIFKSMCVCFLFCVLIFFSLFVYYSKDLPRPERFIERQITESTKIYDRSGEVLLYEIYGEEKRTWVSLEKIPEHLKQAVVATEDQNFYEHFGVDLTGIIRSISINLQLRKAISGGSTIDQQLIRSTFLTNKKTIERKIKEIILSIELDRRHSKDQIIEWYLNQIPFGSNCYGVEAVSQTYFKKSVSDISLEESAILASLIQAPSRLSPYGNNLDSLLKRKDYVLSRMNKCEYISEQQLETAKNIAIEFAPKTTSTIKAPHFALYIKKQLEREYGEEFLRQKGLKIYSSLDWDLQETAEKIVEETTRINESYNAYNLALIAINPKNGEILTMIGSKNWYSDNSYPEGCSSSKKECLFEPKFNVATLGYRQPGSAFKPFAYTTAFKREFTPETVIWDVETDFEVWGDDSYIPQNYDEKFRGPITLRESLAQSLNVPSVKTLYLSGIKETIETAKTLGITTLNEKPSFYGLSLVLGGGEIKLLDIVSSYGVLANRGLKTPPISILKIEDLKGNIIKENKKTAQRVLESNITDLVTSILSDNISRTPMFGPKSALYFENYDVAAKTGTTQEFKDAWTIGYSPSIVIGVWVGNNNNEPMDEKPSIVLAGPTWHRLMEYALKKFPKENFSIPKQIKTEKPVLMGEINWEDPHSILHYVDKNNPQGKEPKNPKSDSQYDTWEQAIKNWIENQNQKE